MDQQSKSVYLQCEDHAEVLVFDFLTWGDGDDSISFSIMDSYVGRNSPVGLFARLRRAWHALTAKPIYHAEVVVTDKERARSFLVDCQAALK